MKREKGFTLIELLSVVVVLGITFMFVLPKLVGLISDGEEKEIQLIEERVLSAAKDYVNYIDGSFYTKLFKEGDTNYIYKTDLIKSGLIDKEEITKLDTFAGVKGELLEDDKIKYTVEYIDAEPEEYTNEELYLMIQNMGGGNSSGGGVSNDAIDDLQNQINENKNSIQNNTSSINNLNEKSSFLDAYPVGSVYISTSNVNPSTIGGTWESFGTGRTLVGVDASQTEFATVEKTGGEKTHTLTIDEMPSHSHVFNNRQNAGVGNFFNAPPLTANSGTEHKSNSSIDPTGGDQPHNNLQPYITVYMWKRTA